MNGSSLFDSELYVTYSLTIDRQIFISHHTGSRLNLVEYSVIKKQLKIAEVSRDGRIKKYSNNTPWCVLFSSNRVTMKKRVGMQAYNYMQQLCNIIMIIIHVSWSSRVYNSCTMVF